MKKIVSLMLAFLFMLSLAPSFAYTLSTGDLMVVQYANSAPMYASHNAYDSTVITYVPRGAVVMYIAAVDRGYCVAYENFVGYIDEYYLWKVNSYYYDFTLPSGDAYKAKFQDSFYPESGDQPGNSFVTDPPAFSYSPIKIFPSQNISTRTGPGTNYTEPGTFPKDRNFVVYYKTKGGSVNWGYVEFMQNGKMVRAYTGTQRFTAAVNVPYYEEEYTTKTVFYTNTTYYGPGYDYLEAPYEAPVSGESVKAFFTENGWTLIEYTLSNGYLHRGWVPSSCLY